MGFSITVGTLPLGLFRSVVTIGWKVKWTQSPAIGQHITPLWNVTSSLQLACLLESLPAISLHFVFLFSDMETGSQHWKWGATWDYLGKKEENFWKQKWVIEGPHGSGFLFLGSCLPFQVNFGLNYPLSGFMYWTWKDRLGSTDSNHLSEWQKLHFCNFVISKVVKTVRTALSLEDYWFPMSVSVDQSMNQHTLIKNLLCAHLWGECWRERQKWIKHFLWLQGTYSLGEEIRSHKS